MSLLPEINQASAEINKFVAQANIHQTIAPVNPAEFTSPADTLLLASRDPVIREVSVGMTGVEAVENAVSGTPPLSLPNSLGKPLKAWSVDLLPYQEGTGDPAPDNVRPIHGTDKLIITTAGKNLLNSGNASPLTQFGVTFTPNSDGSITVNGTATQNVNYFILNGNMDFPSGTYVLSGCPAGGGSTTYRMRTDKLNGTVRANDTGSSATFTVDDGKLYSTFITIWNGATVNNLVFHPQICLASAPNPTDFTPYLAPSQTVIDVPPLSANQWDEEWEVGTINNTTGEPSPDPSNIRSKNYIPVTPNESYYFYKSTSIATLRYYWYDVNYGFIDGGVVSNEAKTAPSNAHYLKIRTTGTYGDTFNHDFCVNYPATVTTYNPYNATVYTGTIGSEGGESRTAEVDMGELNWIYHSDRDVFYYTTPDGKPTGVGRSGYGMCEAFNVMIGTSYANLTNGQMAVGTNFVSAQTASVVVKDSRFTDAAQFKAAVSGIKLIYEIATPTTFAVPSSTIPTPTGTATTWATAEDGTVDGMEVTYYKSE